LPSTQYQVLMTLQHNQLSVVLKIWTKYVHLLGVTPDTRIKFSEELVRESL
jgi:hypothetical protein